MAGNKAHLELEVKLEFDTPAINLFVLRHDQNIATAYKAIVDIIASEQELKTHKGDKASKPIKSRPKGLRFYFADAGSVLPDKNIEIRLEERHNRSHRLMLKEALRSVDAGDDTHPKNAMCRAETKFKLDTLNLKTLGDIERFDKKFSKLPDSLTGLFEGKAFEEPIYPVAKTLTERDKILFSDTATINKHDVEIVFELASDRGYAETIKGDIYRLDQIELEIKDIIKPKSGKSALKKPMKIGLTQGAMIQHASVILDKKAAEFIERFDMNIVNQSKSKKSYDSTKGFLRTHEGMEKAQSWQQEFLQNESIKKDHVEFDLHTQDNASSIRRQIFQPIAG